MAAVSRGFTFMVSWSGFCWTKVSICANYTVLLLKYSQIIVNTEKNSLGIFLWVSNDGVYNIWIEDLLFVINDAYNNEVVGRVLADCLSIYYRACAGYPGCFGRALLDFCTAACQSTLLCVCSWLKHEYKAFFMSFRNITTNKFLWTYFVLGLGLHNYDRCNWIAKNVCKGSQSSRKYSS